MTLETNVCPNCGYALKENDDYCSRCGKFKNSIKTNSLSQFYPILIVSFLISIIFPVVINYLSMKIYPLPVDIFWIFYVLDNLYTQLIISELVFYIIILALFYIFYKLTYDQLNRDNINVFILYEFIITGLGSVFGMLLNYFGYPLFTSHIGLQLEKNSLLLFMVLTFVLNGLTLTSFCIFGWLSPNLFSKVKSESTKNQKSLIFLFSISLGIVSSFLFYILQLFLTFILSTVGSVFTNQNINTFYFNVIYAANGFASLIAIGTEIFLIYTFVTKNSIPLEEKRFFKDSFLIYLFVSIGSFISLVVLNEIINLLMQANNVTRQYYSFSDIFNFISRSLYFSLPVSILLISFILLKKNGFFTSKTV